MKFVLPRTLHGLLLIVEKGCYVFTLDEAESASQRPWKRRKTEPVKAPTGRDAEILLAPLLNGLEGTQSMRSRSELLDVAWGPKESLLKVPT